MTSPDAGIREIGKVNTTIAFLDTTGMHSLEIRTVMPVSNGELVVKGRYAMLVDRILTNIRDDRVATGSAWLSEKDLTDAQKQLEAERLRSGKPDLAKAHADRILGEIARLLAAGDKTAKS